MRSLVLAAGLLLPYAGRAQLFGSSGEFKDGFYVLTSNRNVRQPGELRLDNGSKLVVKTPDGHRIRLRPEQVHSFRIGLRDYTTARDFRVQGGLGMNVDEAFVEKVDSGQIVLMRYEYTVGSPAMMGSGGMMLGGGVSSLSAYLLKFARQDEYVSVQPAFYSTAGGSRFRNAVRPFLAGHPDLLKLLDEKHLTMDNLAAVIHAINIGKTYRLPLSHDERMKQQALTKQARKEAMAVDSAKK